MNVGVCIVTAFLAPLSLIAVPAKPQQQNPSPSAPSTKKPQTKVSFAGKWSSDWGPVELTDNLSGSWNQGGGVGQITGGSYDDEKRQVLFQYYQPWNEMYGTCTMTLSADSNTLSGAYTQQQSGQKAGSGGGGGWSMTRDKKDSKDKDKDSQLQKIEDRHLTSGEVLIAKEVFGKSIKDYDAILIHHRKLTFLGVNPFQDENGAVTLKDNIYFGPSDPVYSDDFSTSSASARHHFIHEMTHIYQYGINRDVVGRVALHSTDRIYQYTLDEKKTFNDYGIEQQAALVADYYGITFSNPQYNPTNCRGKFSQYMYIRILPFVPN